MSTIRSLSSHEFDEEFGPLYYSIFSRKGIDARPFSIEDWQILLLPYGGNMEEHDFRALTAAAEACGDREIVLVDAESTEPPEAAVVIPGSYAAFEKAKFRPGTNFTVMDTHIFGRSGRWGCICAASLDDIALLGGDYRFITAFDNAVGGLSALQARFLDFARNEWSLDEVTKSKVIQLAVG